MTDPYKTRKADPPSPGARVGRFVVLDVLGAGAFGTVYLARDPDLDRTVALKVPHPGAFGPGHRDRFVREARAAAAIHHPNVCPVYEVGTAGDLPFIVMYHVAGPSLAGFLDARPGPLPVPLALALAHKLALGVAAAHDRGVTHRDLKPGNALCDPATGEVLVTDFGLARLAAGSHSTADGAVVGTPAYMSPEQARGRQAEVGPASDVYALGAILYRLLAGDVPFRGSVFEVLAQHASAPAPAPSAARPDLDPRADAVCARALAKAPADRYPDARALADALAALAQQLGADLAARLPFDEPPSAAPPSAPPEPTLPNGLQATTVPTDRPPPAPEPRRTEWFVALLVVLTATAGALALFWPQLRERFAPPDPRAGARPGGAQGSPADPAPTVTWEKLVGVWKAQSPTAVNPYWEFWIDGTCEERAGPAPGAARRPFALDGPRIGQTVPNTKGEVRTWFTVTRLDDDELVGRVELGVVAEYKRVRPERPERPRAELLVGVWERAAAAKGPAKGDVRWEFTRDMRIASGTGAPVAQPYALTGDKIQIAKGIPATIVKLTETELVVKIGAATEWTFRRAPKDKPHSAKEVMRALHGPDGALPPLEAAVLKPDWPAARARADEVVALTAALVKSAPPKGNAASWDKHTAAHAQAARDLLGATASADAAKARTHLNRLKSACTDCHAAHK